MVPNPRTSATLDRKDAVRQMGQKSPSLSAAHWASVGKGLQRDVGGLSVVVQDWCRPMERVVVEEGEKTVYDTQLVDRMERMVVVVAGMVSQCQYDLCACSACAAV